MQSQSAIKHTEQGFRVSGDLVFLTVSALIENGKKRISQLDLDTIQINLDSVERVDSAGVALLLGWKRDCLAAQKSCYFQNIPQQAKVLLETYKLSML